MAATTGALRVAGFSEGLLTTMLLSLAVAMVPREQDNTITCLQSKKICYENLECQGRLNKIPDYCDDAVDRCDSPRFMDCYRLLSVLQRIYPFQGCYCDHMDRDASECTELKKVIFHHECYNKAVSGGNSSYSNPRETSVMRTYRDMNVMHQDVSSSSGLLMVTGASGPVDHHSLEYKLKNGGSCISIRKHCLQDAKCKETFTDFGVHCEEYKRRGICVSNDWDKCFKAIEILKTWDIFNCDCSQLEREVPKTKCEHIQYRIANNSCLEEVSYYVHTINHYMSSISGRVIPSRTYSPLVLHENDTNNTEKTCLTAFQDCEKDEACSRRKKDLDTSCTWISEDHTCDKVDCLRAIQNFYLYVRPQLSQGLLFCRCKPGHTKCEAVKQSLFPTCSVMESPPPSCMDILDRCKADADCSARLRVYIAQCKYETNPDSCLTPSASYGHGCRGAIVDTMGTLITTNCTCRFTDPDRNAQCEQARRIIQRNNTCTDHAIKGFHEQKPRAMSVWQENMAPDTHLPDCQRLLRQNVPSYMAAPTAIRQYHNDSNCSDVCQCLRNGTLTCVTLPCKPPYSCITGHLVRQTHKHGSTFIPDNPDQGHCRCIKAESVCSKSTRMRLSEAGLFLHVGYSVSELHLVDDHVNSPFDPQSVAGKLGALMNADSAEQFCSLRLHRRDEGNLVFRIEVSEVSPKLTRAQGCSGEAKLLSNMINSRLPVIIRDAELSVLKIADLQNIEIHKPTNSDNRRSIPVDGALGVAAWSAQSDRTLLTLMVVMATLLTGWSASSSCSSSQS